MIKLSEHPFCRQQKTKLTSKSIFSISKIANFSLALWNSAIRSPSASSVFSSLWYCNGIQTGGNQNLAIKRSFVYISSSHKSINKRTLISFFLVLIYTCYEPLRKSLGWQRLSIPYNTHERFLQKSTSNLFDFVKVFFILFF